METNFGGRWEVYETDENLKRLKYFNKLVKLYWNYEISGKFLKYIDPYGNTIFNHYQIDDLIIDLEYLKTIEGNDKLLIDELIVFVKEGKEVHQYILFEGE